ncbi:MAG: hypothetical protein HZC38_00495, partial [Chloroflexi bacterium]|nr:hypothetical protein [Chloroflexota bacterium]
MMGDSNTQYALRNTCFVLRIPYHGIFVAVGVRVFVGRGVLVGVGVLVGSGVLVEVNV